MNRCRACGAPIRWARTAANGKPIPLDLEPHPDGNVTIVDGAAHVAGPSDDKTRFMPHHATCPNWAKR